MNMNTYIQLPNYSKKCNHSISTTNAENDAYSFTTFFLSLRIIIQSISIIIHSYTTVVELCTFADKKKGIARIFLFHHYMSSFCLITLYGKPLLSSFKLHFRFLKIGFKMNSNFW